MKKFGLKKPSVISFVALSSATGLIMLSGCVSNNNDTSVMAPYLKELMVSESVADQEKDFKAKEEYIAQCMLDQGFDYVPYIGNVGFVENSGYQSFSDSINPKISEDFGYAKDFQNPIENTDSDQIDPNRAYYEGLSDQGKFDYGMALEGYSDVEGFESKSKNTGDDSEEDSENGVSYEVGGCRKEASEKLAPKSAKQKNIDFLLEEYSDLYSKFTESSELAAADKKLTSCMLDQGYKKFSGYESYFNILSSKYRELVDSNSGKFDAAAYNELHDFEKKYKKDLYACAVSSDYIKVYDEITNKFDKEFYQKYKDVLAEL